MSLHTNTTPQYRLTAWLVEHDQAAAELFDATDARPVAQCPAASAPLPVRRASAERAVPPGRLGWRATATHRTAYSVVSADAFSVLCADGRVGPDPCHLDDGEYINRPAYDWLRWQMLQRIPGYPGRYPMWMWLRVRRLDLVDQLRSAARFASGSVLLTLWVPR